LSFKLGNIKRARFETRTKLQNAVCTALKTRLLCLGSAEVAEGHIGPVRSIDGAT